MKFHLLKVILLSLSLVSCFKKKQSDHSTLPLKETFRFNIGSEPPTLDWNKATDTTSSLIVDNIMDGLLNYDFSKNPAGLKPALAEKWTSTPDGKIWTFTMRKGVKWSDGKEFKASHIKDGWERLLNPNTASEYAYFLYPIKNARAYSEGKIKDFSQVGISISEQGQLVVELKKGKSYFPYFVSHTSTYPIRKDIIEKYGNRWTDPQNIVTLGAYNLKVWEHDKRIVLERNTGYYNQAAKIKNILIHIIPESGTALNLFEQGKMDAIGDLPSRELPVLRKKKEYRSHPIMSIYYYGINIKKKPFDDVRVRKAFNMAIDRKQITNLLKGDQVPLRGWVPTDLLGYDPSIGFQFNSEKAQELMDEAGYRDRSTFPRVTISYNTHEDHKRVAAKVQAQLKKYLNIQVELANEEWKTYLQSLKTGRQQVYRMGWVADYPDPDNFMTLMTSYSENNHTGWGNDRYDSLVEKAGTLLDEKERLRLYVEAQKILIEQESAVIPIYSAQSHWLISDRVAVFPLNIMGKISFKEVELK
ncbi:MAG: peptide ABC transporter substrate-binding protein [Oligoflexia bacterium]|nr:peptide ABC transporter substrate-binding protein [Oligoflexia bacterium]